MNNRDLNAYRDEYLGNYGFEKMLVEYRRRNLLEILARYAPQKILEVGCGVESLAGFYTTFAEFTIVEPIKNFINRIPAQLGGKVEGKVHYVNKNLEDAVGELKKENFDFIVISNLIHELNNPDVILKAACELAGPNTIIHINTPNAKSIHRQLGMKMGLLKHAKELSRLACALQRNQEYELFDLVRMARKHGLKVREQGSYFIKPLSHAQMQTLLESGKISKEFLDGIYKIGHLLPENGSEIFVNLQLKERCR